MIPRVFHRIWLGPPLPDAFVAYGQALQRLHPNWTLVEWGEHNRPPLRNEELYRAAERCVPEANVWQFRSDLLRYELLWRHGGLYVDCDFEPQHPIDPVLGDADLFATWEVDDTWIANGLLGSRAAHPFIRDLIEGIPDSLAAQPGVTPNRTTGPQYLTRRYRALKPAMTIAPSRQFYPYYWTELEHGRATFPDATFIHHWNNQRRKQRKPL